ncbi:hypothetical protein [Streptomyces sp. HC307]|uniref:hypothetical protein n=1 Tax=Streptomyces flavusporus TaxID=3385496 RepID=UPI003916DEDC
MNSNIGQAETGAPSREEIRAELVGRAIALQPLLRDQAARGESERVLPTEVVDALTEAGVFRLLTPGGTAATRPTCGP